MTKIRVILVDDHPVVRTGIHALLERAPDITVVGEAENGTEALALLAERSADVLLLDVEMPNFSGIDVALAIKERGIAVNILALSAHADRHSVYKVLESGVSGYLIKEEAPRMIIDAVRGVASGQKGWMSREVSALLNNDAFFGNDKRQLSPRETDVLTLIVDGKSNQEIAHALKISASTVEKHITSLLTKLDVSSRVEAAVHAVRNALV